MSKYLHLGTAHLEGREGYGEDDQPRPCHRRGLAHCVHISRLGAPEVVVVVVMVVVVMVVVVVVVVMVMVMVVVVVVGGTVYFGF